MKNLTAALFLLLSLRAAGQATIYIQPHFAAGNEADLFSLVPAGTGYLNPEFDIIGWTSGGTPVIDRHVIRFDPLLDTSVIPAGAHISSAKLVLFGRSTSPEMNYGNSLFPGSTYPNSNQGWINLLATPFSKYTVNWATQPSILHTDSVSTPVSYMQWNQDDTIDVTPLVIYLISHGNYGLMFRLQNESPYAERMWSTCNETDSTKHPLLIVTLCPNLLGVSPRPDTVIAGNNARFFVSGPTTGLTYQWQENPGTGFVSLANVWPYSGVTTDTLTIHNTSTHLDATRYRCIISDGAYCTDTSSPALLTVTTTTRIGQLNASKVTIFPNPAKNVLTVEGNKISAISIYNPVGQLVYTKSVDTQKTEIDISALPAGLFLVMVTDIDGNKAIQKITKE
jgi:hypothetical protein